MHMHSGDKILRMRGGNHDVILSLNVLPNGKHIGQTQKQTRHK